MSILERWSRGWFVKALFMYNRTENMFGRELCQASRQRDAKRKAARARRRA